MKRKKLLSLLLSLGMLLSLASAPAAALEETEPSSEAATEVTEPAVDQNDEQLPADELPADWAEEPQEAETKDAAEDSVPDPVAEDEFQTELQETEVWEHVSQDAAFSESSNETVYVLMNIPYSVFYPAQGTTSEVDAYSSATKSKPLNGNLAGGSYHVNADGSDITGVIYPVQTTTAALSGLNRITDESSVTITVTTRGTTTETTYTGKDALFEAPSYSYYILSEAPSAYMVYENGGFSAVTGTQPQSKNAAPALKDNAHHTDIEITMNTDALPEGAVVCAATVTAGSDVYGLRHVCEIWRNGLEIGWNWSDLDGKGLEGKTISNVTYYLRSGEIYSYDTSLAIPCNPGSPSASFLSPNVIHVSGLPEEAQNIKATVASKVGRGETAVVLAEDVSVRNGMIVVSHAVAGTTYNVTIRADGFLPATAQAVCNRIESAELTLTGQQLVYNGQAQKPALALTAGETTLTPGTDYLAFYIDNKDVGEGLVYVIGRGSWAGSQSTAFSIQPLSLTSADVTLSKTSYSYTGKAITPNVTVQTGSNILQSGTDYTVTVTNNQNVGTATVTVTGTGNCTGSVQKTFRITPAKLSASNITLSKTSYTYTGKTITPAVSVKYGSVTLKKGTDYTVTVKNNKNVGTASVTVTGKGNYTGTATKTFTILPKGTTLSKLTAGNKKLTASWKKQAAQTTGYKIQLSTDSKFTKDVKTVTVKGGTKTSSNITGLKAKTTYYVRICTYRTVGSKTYTSGWSKAVKMKTK